MAEFEADPTPARRSGGIESDGQLILDLDGYDGPIDLLLVLAREQKVDLAQISILQLAEQYLAFVERARRVKLELAADYLVMAAWLAWLKSRLLLPDIEPDEEAEDPERMAATLAARLRKLEAMQAAAQRLLERPLLGRERFRRGAPEAISSFDLPSFEASLHDLLAAYAGLKRSEAVRGYAVDKFPLMTIEEAVERLRRSLGSMPRWTTLKNFVPAEGSNPLMRRSALAATFGATLELARRGVIELRQDGSFGDIYVRATGKEA